jgi:hypothetical protein
MNGGEEEHIYEWENQRKRPLGSPRCKLVDNIKFYLGEIVCGGMGWIDLA